MTARPEDDDGHADELAAEIASELTGSRYRIAVAESLTSGLIATTLGAAPHSSTWFLGGVVAYASEVKHKLLGVPPGPVVSEEAAVAMARGAASLFGAEICLSVTGVGGPQEQDCQPVGTVFFGCASPRGELHVVKRQLHGSPDEIVRSTVVAGLRLLVSRVHGLVTEDGTARSPRS